MGGHGWIAYYKQEPDTVFKEPSPEAGHIDDKICFDKQKMQEWNEIIKTIPEEKEKTIRESEEYKKFEQHMKSNKPDVEDMIDFILDTVIDGLKHGKKSKDDSDMVI